MPPHSPAAKRAHDVVVVGGGLVGASLAIALDRIGGIDVALVEAAPQGALPAVFDERNLSFAEATVNALSTLGVMRLLQAPTGPIRSIHVSRVGDLGRVRMDAADYGRDAFGQVVVARDFGMALEARLHACARVTRYRPARFTGVDPADGNGRRDVRIECEGEGERILSTCLLVAADGTRSSVRAALGIEGHGHDYGQRLFVARVRASRPPDGTAWERFGPDGPTALLPRGDRHHGVVHAVAVEQAAAVEALDDAAFLQRLQAAFGWRAGRFVSVGPRSVYPAMKLVATRTIAPHAVLVGNAAQTLHPIGAQGFNLGLRDALTLAELVEDLGIAAVETGLLEQYERRRREDRARTLAFSDGLARATVVPGGAASLLRAFGLFAGDRAASLQGRLVGGAMGYRGDVPRLCRGDAA